MISEEIDALNSLIDEKIDRHIQINNTYIQQKIIDVFEKHTNAIGNTQIAEALPEALLVTMELAMRIGSRATISALVESGLLEKELAP